MDKLHVLFFDDFKSQGIAGRIGKGLCDDLLLLLLTCFFFFRTFFIDVLSRLFCRLGSLSRPADERLTAEKAGEVNTQATEYETAEKTTREPFSHFCKGHKFETVCFQGTVRAASAIPNPAQNDYDNCLYALLVEIDSLLSDGKDKKIANEILVNVPIMENKTILQDHIFHPGDKIQCTCAEYDAMPQAIQEIQLADDIQSYEHQPFYSFEIRKIPAFSKGGNRDFSKRIITLLPIHPLPADEKAAAARKERIRSEILRVEKEIRKHGGSFSAWKKEYKSIAEKYDVLCQAKFNGWINDSFFAAGEAETEYRTRDYIEGILPYKKYLEENNIDLIIVRIPSKWDFAARVLGAEDFQENPAWVEHYYECLKNDIEIVDPMPEMWKARFDFPLFYYYHVYGENHPFEGQALVSAKTLADVLKRYRYEKTKQEIILTDFSFQTDDSRWFWPDGNKKFDRRKNIIFKTAVQNDNAIGVFEDNSGSPFLFLSNSFFWHPRRPLGASVPSYTAFFLQALPDWLYQDGMHNPMLRNLITKPQLLNNRRAVIMVGHPDDWKGFPPMPRYIQENARTITLEKTIDLLSNEVIINDNYSFLHSVKKNRSVFFVPNVKIPIPQQVNYFDIGFKIPYVEGQKTCMVRVNFTTSNITLKLMRADDGMIIDSCAPLAGVNTSADLFVPLSNQTCEFKILFQPKHFIRKYTTLIKSIELWYY